MLPLTAGFLIAGPTSGWLSDRFGARPFATGGMVLAALTFGLLEVLPVNFAYPVFAVLLTNGLAMGLFASPNRAAIMNSLPATLTRGLTAQGVPAAAARVAHLPPTATVFGAFLGYNPIHTLLGPTGVLTRLPHAKAAYLTGRSFFPSLISAPFASGLHEAFDFAIAAMLIAAAASWLRGKQPGRTGIAAGGAPSPASIPAPVAGPPSRDDGGPDRLEDRRTAHNGGGRGESLPTGWRPGSRATDSGPGPAGHGPDREIPG